jgi:hypothetical protein
MAWCGAGNMYSSNDSGPIEGWNKKEGRCVVLREGPPLTLAAVPCDEFYRPLCEVNFYLFKYSNVLIFKLF